MILFAVRIAIMRFLMLSGGGKQTELQAVVAGQIGTDFQPAHSDAGAVMCRQRLFANVGKQRRFAVALKRLGAGHQIERCGGQPRQLEPLVIQSVWAEGKHITTLEGLMGPNGELSDIQQAFMEETAIQCGFCTPGFVMTAVEILDRGVYYTDDQLRKLLSGHLCRCTGYENIFKAVKKTMLRRLVGALP